jgi:hypothetical protein
MCYSKYKVPKNCSAQNPRMKVLLLCISHILFLSGLAQPDTTYVPKVWIKTAPFSNIITYDGSIANVGLEFRMGDRFALNSELGMYYSMPFKSVYLTNHQGLLIREEVKKYSQTLASKWRSYVSLELSYSDQSFDAVDTALQKLTILRDSSSVVSCNRVQ